MTYNTSSASLYRVLYRVPSILFFLLCSSTILFAQESSPYVTYAQGDFTRAIVESDALIKNDPSNISAYAVKAWSYVSLKRWNEALETAQKALEINPRDSRILQVMGEAYYELDEYDLALQYFDEYLRQAPNGALSDWVFFFLGEIYRSKKQFAKADISYAAAIQKSPNKVSWILVRARLKEQRNQPDQALVLYRRALTLDASDSSAQNALRRLAP